jgi:hypothetical protein
MYWAGHVSVDMRCANFIANSTRARLRVHTHTHTHTRARARTHTLHSLSCVMRCLQQTHHYERTWPVFNGTETSQNYWNPTSTVHVQSGIAGTGGADQFSVAQASDIFRVVHTTLAACLKGPLYFSGIVGSLSRHQLHAMLQSRNGA